MISSDAAFVVHVNQLAAETSPVMEFHVRLGALVTGFGLLLARIAKQIVKDIDHEQYTESRESNQN